MIYTLTLNPALDYIAHVSDYKEGRVNRADSCTIMPGGKGINVSYVLSNLAVETTALGFIGGFSGKELERLLKKDNIKTDFVNINNDNTRINLKIKTSCETEINTSGPHITQTELNELFDKLGNIKENDCIVLAGSVPSSLGRNIYALIAQRIGKGVKIVADAEGELLTGLLCYRPFLIKPNHHELGAIAGRELHTKEKILEAAQQLQSMGAANVFVSMAEKGGIFLSEEKTAYFSPSPVGKVINSTGAGDSCVAGFLAEYSASHDYKKAFIKGLCAGSATAFSEGLAARAQIEELYKTAIDNKVERLA